MYYAEVYKAFKAEALAAGVKVFNQLNGKADMPGKQYLVDLTKAGYPVIPSLDNQNELDILPVTDRYVTKLKLRSDSVGMEYISNTQLHNIGFTDNFVQPVMDFNYEVSFFFINHEFQYAL